MYCWQPFLVVDFSKPSILELFSSDGFEYSPRRLAGCLDPLGEVLVYYFAMF
jgi:hypothetical protein